SCWEVIAGRDAAGGIVCHPGCSVARLAQEGWPVRCTDLHVRTPLGRRRLTISTIVLRDEDDMTVLHPVRETAEPTTRTVAVQRKAPADSAPAADPLAARGRNPGQADRGAAHPVRDDRPQPRACDPGRARRALAARSGRPRPLTLAPGRR